MKAAFTEEQKALVKAHVQEIVQGAVFKGSNRSRQFLQHIIKEYLAGHEDGLKERIIGIELFGRIPSYDTSEDAIVRVTASDVRRRLFQHYGQYGKPGGIQISLPLGSYTPEISFPQADEPSQAVKQEADSLEQSLVPLQREVVSTESPGIKPALPNVESAHAGAHEVTAARNILVKYRWAWILVLNLVALSIILMRERSHSQAEPDALPWSALFGNGRSVQIIPSDPNIAEVKQYFGNEISASDYANLHSIPNSPNSTDESRLRRGMILTDERIASFDAQIAIRIVAHAKENAKRVRIRATRSIQLSELRSDENFVLIGSPESNPWSALFSDQLDFRFTFDKQSGQEIISNPHPRSQEKPLYIPTALGGATGTSYAIVALVRNLDRTGHVLVIAGADSEGTEAVGNLVTDSPRFSEMLRQCGVAPEGPARYFELLIKVSTMAGSPLNTEMEACHILSQPE